MAAAPGTGLPRRLGAAAPGRQRWPRAYAATVAPAPGSAPAPTDAPRNRHTTRRPCSSRSPLGSRRLPRSTAGRRCAWWRPSCRLLVAPRSPHAVRGCASRPLVGVVSRQRPVAGRSADGRCRLGQAATATATTRWGSAARSCRPACGRRTARVAGLGCGRRAATTAGLGCSHRSPSGRLPRPTEVVAGAAVAQGVWLSIRCVTVVLVMLVDRPGRSRRWRRSLGRGGRPGGGVHPGHGGGPTGGGPTGGGRPAAAVAFRRDVHPPTAVVLLTALTRPLRSCC